MSVEIEKLRKAIDDLNVTITKAKAYIEQLKAGGGPADGSLPAEGVNSAADELIAANEILKTSLPADAQPAP